MSEWGRSKYISQMSEAIIKEYSGCEVISSLVIKTRWARNLNTEYRDRCRLEIEIFLNRLMGRLLKSHHKRRVVVNLFWEMGGVLHCHCVIGWPLFLWSANGLEGVDERGRFLKFREGALKGLQLIQGVWLEDRQDIDQGYIQYCLKEFDCDGFSGVDRVRIWDTRRVPADAWEYVERLKNQRIGVLA